MADIATVVTALAPAFAVGLGIQHFNELLDPLISKFVPDSNWKKFWMGALSLAFGGLATNQLRLGIIGAITVSKDPVGWLDVVVTALIISTGTEGINSIIKFMGYAKDEKKAAAATSENSAGKAALSAVNREP